MSHHFFRAAKILTDPTISCESKRQRMTGYTGMRWAAQGKEPNVQSLVATHKATQTDVEICPTAVNDRTQSANQITEPTEMSTVCTTNHEEGAEKHNAFTDNGIFRVAPILADSSASYDGKALRTAGYTGCKWAKQKGIESNVRYPNSIHTGSQTETGPEQSNVRYPNSIHTGSQTETGPEQSTRQDEDQTTKILSELTTEPVELFPESIAEQGAKEGEDSETKEEEYTCKSNMTQNGEDIEESYTKIIKEVEPDDVQIQITTTTESLATVTSMTLPKKMAKKGALYRLRKFFANCFQCLRPREEEGMEEEEEEEEEGKGRRRGRRKGRRTTTTTESREMLPGI